MSEDGIDYNRRRFLTTTASVVGGVGAVATTVPFISTMTPSAKARALGAPVEVDIGDIAPGERLIIKWQGKPVWILHRTDETLADLDDMTDLVRDPDSEVTQQPDYAKNAYRAIRDEYLVVIGLCTHLGCSPTFYKKDGDHELGADWNGGFFCPCHGSSFDLAGRVFKGVPAPSNLIVPPHIYLSETRLVIGEDSGVT
jgi:ubiquinol-cytochrome c reductase iron-sulfur subunit